MVAVLREKRREEKRIPGTPKLVRPVPVRDSLRSKVDYLGIVIQAFNPSTTDRDKEISEFKASTVYTASSRPARATQ